MRKWTFLLLSFATICAVAGAGAGCNMDDKPSDMRARQDAAMRDPFNYSAMDGPNDISGGGMTDFKTDAFMKDVNSVFSP